MWEWVPGGEHSPECWDRPGNCSGGLSVFYRWLWTLGWRRARPRDGGNEGGGSLDLYCTLASVSSLEPV